MKTLQQNRRRPLLTACCACAFLIAALAGSPRAGAHPHGPDTNVVLNGTLTKVDPGTETIEMDTIDKRSLTKRNVLLFVERKAKLRHGKRRLTLAELAPGQRVTCFAERENDQDGRLIAFEVRVLDK
jgi:hypothetical protein